MEKVIRTCTIWADGDVTNEYCHPAPGEEGWKHAWDNAKDLEKFRNEKDPRVVRCWVMSHNNMASAEAQGDHDRERYSTGDWFWSKKTA